MNGIELYLLLAPLGLLAIAAGAAGYWMHRTR